MGSARAESAMWLRRPDARSASWRVAAAAAGSTMIVVLAVCLMPMTGRADDLVPAADASCGPLRLGLAAAAFFPSGAGCGVSETSGGTTSDAPAPVDCD